MRARIALACLSLLAVSGCGRHASQPAKPQSEAAVPQAVVPSADAPPAALNCPEAPLKSAVQDAIKNALVQIYGVDEGPARVVVGAMTPSDCSTFHVTYTASGTPASTTLTRAGDGSWSVTLFGKSYPVH